MANAENRIIINNATTPQTVYLIPGNGRAFSNEEIASLLSGLPQFTQSQSVVNPPIVSEEATLVQDNNQVNPSRDNSVQMELEVSTSTISSETVTEHFMQSSFSKMTTPKRRNQVLNSISPNVLTPDCSPIVGTANYTSTASSSVKTHSSNADIQTPIACNKRLPNRKVITPTAANQLLTPESSPKITPFRVKIYPTANPVTSDETVPANPQSSVTNATIDKKIEAKSVTPFGTLVFLDLETTGLGHIIGKSNVHITEISMVALDRKEFWQSKNSELKDVRIIQKLSMCIRPRTSVSPGAAKITGLDNDNLVDQCPFDRNVGSTIISFLSHLPKPICLLAHNGAAFDFPLLKAELKRLSMQLPLDVKYVDTLVAFRSIGIAESPPDRKVCKSVKYGKNGRLSHSLENLHLFFFNKKPTGGHSSEGDCIALAKVCHKLKDEALPWIEANARSLEHIQPMW